jgi:hypothetical protein
MLLTGNEGSSLIIKPNACDDQAYQHGPSNGSFYLHHDPGMCTIYFLQYILTKYFRLHVHLLRYFPQIVHNPNH